MMRAFKRPVLVLCALVLLTSLGERVAFGFAHALGYTPILETARLFPLYQPMTFRKLAARFGLQQRQADPLHYGRQNTLTEYPRSGIPVVAPERALSVIWVVSESLRADMLEPAIMPRTWAFATRGANFTHHMSGGNGTRMGMFSMFYGLYGTYWHTFLNHRRGPVLIDVLQRSGYDMRAQTSAHFTYPEFDKTLFVDLPASALLEDDDGAYWQRDRRNIDAGLKWVGSRDPARPFFYFQFLESPHANYSFPAEAVIRPNYVDPFNYATLDPHIEITQVKNRYINAVHHLDQQLGKLFDGLQAQGLLNKTIVLVTGDHGEEFMEHGHWGHNSAFSPEQVGVPLVIVAPGVAPAVIDRLTSHVDIAPTVLNLLGIHAPAEEYSLGFDLFGPVRRADTLVSEWDRSALIDEQYTIELSLNAYSFGIPPVTHANGSPADATAVYARYVPRLTELLEEMRRF